MRAVWLLAIAPIIVIACPAHAEDRLQVRPGMSLAEVTEILKPKCREYIVDGKGEKYVTCLLGEGHAPSVITATVTHKDRTEYIQWRDLLTSPPAEDHADKAAADLGFVSAKSTCTIFAEERPCWAGDAGTFLYDGGYDAASGIYTLYLNNDEIKKADAQ